MGKSNAIKFCLAYMVILPVAFVCGGLCHEVIGHGLVGVLAGGRIRMIEILGVQIWPQIHWVGLQGNLGGCDFFGRIPTTFGSHICSLGGSISTWCVSVLAFVLLWSKQWTGLGRAILVCLSLWCLDLFMYTLPCLGMHHYIFCGSTYPEPYAAAMKLGIPSFLFQLFALMMPFCLLVGLVYSYRGKISADEQNVNGTSQPDSNSARVEKGK